MALRESESTCPTAYNDVIGEGGSVEDNLVEDNPWEV